MMPNHVDVALVINLWPPGYATITGNSRHNGLTLSIPAAEREILDQGTDCRVQHYRVKRLSVDGKVQPVYRGNIASAVTRVVFNVPESIPVHTGVALDCGNVWTTCISACPRFTLDLVVEAPTDWIIIHQGQRPRIGDSCLFGVPRQQDDLDLPDRLCDRVVEQRERIKKAVGRLDNDTGPADRYPKARANFLSRCCDGTGPYPRARRAVLALASLAGACPTDRKAVGRPA